MDIIICLSRIAAEFCQNGEEKWNVIKLTRKPLNRSLTEQSRPVIWEENIDRYAKRRTINYRNWIGKLRKVSASRCSFRKEFSEKINCELVRKNEVFGILQMIWCDCCEKYEEPVSLTIICTTSITLLCHCSSKYIHLDFLIAVTQNMITMLTYRGE